MRKWPRSARRLWSKSRRWPDASERTDEGDILLDPVAGSNTTGAVAERLERRWNAVERVEEYLRSSKFRFDGCGRLRRHGSRRLLPQLPRRRLRCFHSTHGIRIPRRAGE